MSRRRLRLEDNRLIAFESERFVVRASVVVMVLL
jgi:hypothetical protein